MEEVLVIVLAVCGVCDPNVFSTRSQVLHV